MQNKQVFSGSRNSPRNAVYLFAYRKQLWSPAYSNAKKLSQHNQLWRKKTKLFFHVNTGAPAWRLSENCYFLLCRNIKTDIIMHIVVYLFEKVSVFSVVLTLPRNLCIFGEFEYTAAHKLTARAGLNTIREREWEREKLRVHWILVRIVYFYHFVRFTLGGALTLDFSKINNEKITSNNQNGKSARQTTIFEKFLFCLFFESLVKIWSNKWEKRFYSCHVSVFIYML